MSAASARSLRFGQVKTILLLFGGKGKISDLMGDVAKATTGGGDATF